MMRWYTTKKNLEVGLNERKNIFNRVSINRRPCIADVLKSYQSARFQSLEVKLCCGVDFWDSVLSRWDQVKTNVKCGWNCIRCVEKEHRQLSRPFPWVLKHLPTQTRADALFDKCRVLSLSDCKYSLSPLSQTQIDWVGRNRIRWTFKLSCIWHVSYSLGVLLRIKYLLTNN